MKAAVLITLVLGIAAGVVGTLIIGNLYLFTVSSQVSFQIDPLDIVSIAITLLFAWLVASRLNRRDTETRVKKDLFIKRLSNLEELLAAKTRSILSSPHTLTSVNKIMKVLRSTTDREILLAVRHNVITDSDVIAARLQTLMTELWQLLTLTPVAGEAQVPSAYIKDGNVVYGQILEQISEKIIDIRSNIADLQIAINCAD